MPDRAQDWLKQAQKDLEQARDSQRLNHHEWACFAAQQAAEKAVKGLHLHLGQEAWGHVVAKLLEELPRAVTVPADMIEKAKVLDNFYSFALSQFPPGGGSFSALRISAEW